MNPLIRRMRLAEAQRNYLAHHHSPVILPGEPGSRFMTVQLTNPPYYQSNTYYEDGYQGYYDTGYYDDVSEQLSPLSDPINSPINVQPPDDIEGEEEPIFYIEGRNGMKVRAREVVGDDGEPVIEVLDVAEELPSTPQPPIYAVFIIAIFIKGDEQEFQIGDLIEKYPRRYKQFGKCRWRAELWAWSEVVSILWPVVKRAFLKTSGLVALVEWVRRHIS